MKASELRGRDPGDLARELDSLQRELFGLKFRWQAQETPETNRRRQLRKDIARYKTVLRETQLAQQAAQAQTE